MPALQEVEIEDIRTEDESDGGRETEPIDYSISSYGVDFTIGSLVERLRAGAIFIPVFQRRFVWSIKDASRFVESLLIGLPVPGIFLSKEAETGKLLVVDGQQRLLSLLSFYDGIWVPDQRAFALEGVHPSFDGKTYKTLFASDRRTLDEAILHATVFKQESGAGDDSSVYQVYERLNSRLSPQEIRNSIHHDSTISKLLFTLNSHESWRAVCGPEDPRLRDQELILRALAFYSEPERYSPPMSSFLNGFMRRNKDLTVTEADRMRRTFQGSIDAIHAALGKYVFRPHGALNAAVLESVLAGVAKRLDKGTIVDLGALKSAYEALMQDRRFLEACARGTADESRVRTRLGLAAKAFSAIP